MVSVDHFRCPCLKIESVVKVSTTILISSAVLCLRATVTDYKKKLLNNEKKLLRGWKTISRPHRKFSSPAFSPSKSLNWTIHCYVFVDLVPDSPFSTLILSDILIKQN